LFGSKIGAKKGSFTVSNALNQHAGQKIDPRIKNRTAMAQVLWQALC